MDKKPRITMLAGLFYPAVGGAERYSYNLARKLVEDGFRVSVITRRLKGTRKRETMEGIEITRISAPGLPGLSMLTFLLKSILEFRKTKADVIHCFHLFSLGFTGAILGKIYGKPVVVRDGQNIDSLLGYTRNPLTRWMMGYAIRNAREMYVDHGSIMELFLKLGADRERIRVIQNPVDTRAFRPGKTGKGFTLLYLGRLVPFKGLHDLIRAMLGISRKIRDARLVIVGSGPEEGRLKGLAKSLGLKGVRFRGKVPFERAHELYQECHVFVQPSTTYELPNTLLEAMATGNAIIASDMVASRDLLRDMETGLIIKPGDVKAIEESVLLLYRNPGLRRKLGNNARETVNRELSWGPHLKTISGLYGKALQ